MVVQLRILWALLREAVLRPLDRATIRVGGRMGR